MNLRNVQPRPHGHMSLLKKTRRNGPGVGHPRDLILLVEKKVHFPGRITQDDNLINKHGC